MLVSHLLATNQLMSHFLGFVNHNRSCVYFVRLKKFRRPHKHLAKHEVGDAAYLAHKG